MPSYSTQNNITEMQDIIFSLIIDLYEGGYVNDKDDPGGETKYGISKKAFPNIDIRSLTKQKDLDIYRANYWSKAFTQLLSYEPSSRDARSPHISYSQIRHYFTLKVCAFAVNAGLTRCLKTLQQSCNSLLTFAPKNAQLQSLQDKLLAVDGVWGTLSSGRLDYLCGICNAYDLLYAAFCINAITYYCKLCINNKTCIKFLKGWLNRVI